MAARANRSLDRVRLAFQAQLLALAAPSRAIGREDVGRLIFIATDTLRAVEAPTRGAPVTLSDHLYLRELATDETTARIEGLMGGDDVATLARQLDPMLTEVVTVLDGGDLPNTVASSFGVVRLLDYLRASTILAVHLAFRTTGAAQPAATAEAVRALAAVLGERYPGQTIEVRVPPYSAVQVSAFDDGPAHTRGTPPNVIETNPRAFIALATASTDWQQATTDGSLAYSGVHAQEARRMFPIYRLR